MEKEAIYQAIDQLPESSVAELMDFIQFLAFKAHHKLPPFSQSSENEGSKSPRYNPVPPLEGILAEIDFSPTHIAQMRREVWSSFGNVDV